MLSCSSVLSPSSPHWASNDKDLALRSQASHGRRQNFLRTEAATRLKMMTASVNTSD